VRGGGVAALYLEVRMKLFVLCTTSESCDDYEYVIKHPTVPTDDELKAFLIKYGSDVNHEPDDDEDGARIIFEHVKSCTEVSEATAAAIPKMAAKKLASYRTVGCDD
jgi:hypothetical protein